MGSSIDSRASTSSEAPSDYQSTPTRRARNIEIAAVVPLSQLPPDTANAKLFKSGPVSEESPAKSASLPSDTPLSSSLPISSPLIGNDDPDVLPIVGQRANSEMGHYADLTDQRAMLGNKSKQVAASPDQRRKERRRSMNPLKTASIPERPSSPEKDPVLQTPRVDVNGKVKISGPMNGTPIPAGYKFGGKDAPPDQQTASDRREKAKSRSFWGFGRQQHGRCCIGMDCVDIANFCFRQTQRSCPRTPGSLRREPRGVTGRCGDREPTRNSIPVHPVLGGKESGPGRRYLPSQRKLCRYQSVEGPLQQWSVSVSSLWFVVTLAHDDFATEGDVDLLGSDENWDPHAIAGLLKTFLRELPASILTRDLHLRFLSVIGEFLRRSFLGPMSEPKLHRLCRSARTYFGALTADSGFAYCQLQSSSGSHSTPHSDRTKCPCEQDDDAERGNRVQSHPGHPGGSFQPHAWGV